MRSNSGRMPGNGRTRAQELLAIAHALLGQYLVLRAASFMAPQQMVEHVCPVHAGIAVQLLERELQSEIGECLVPARQRLLDAIDQGALDIENQGWSSTSKLHLEAFGFMSSRPSQRTRIDEVSVATREAGVSIASPGRAG